MPGQRTKQPLRNKTLIATVVLLLPLGSLWLYDYLLVKHYKDKAQQLTEDMTLKQAVEYMGTPIAVHYPNSPGEIGIAFYDGPINQFLRFLYFKIHPNTWNSFDSPWYEPKGPAVTILHIHEHTGLDQKISITIEGITKPPEFHMGGISTP